MNKIIFMAFLAATLSAESCYTLIEPTIGSLGLETYNRIQNNQEELTKALNYQTAFKLIPGSKFCNTKEFSHTWGAKRVDVSGQLLWIDSEVKATEI